MTPTISPVAGSLPMQPATSSNCATPPPPLTSAPTTSAPATATTTAGGDTPASTPTAQAAQGAANLQVEQLIPAIQQVIASIQNLITSIQGGAVTGGGAPGGTPGQVGQCGMAGCTMNHAAGTPTQGGANAAPDAPQAPGGTGQSVDGWVTPSPASALRRLTRLVAGTASWNTARP